MSPNVGNFVQDLVHMAQATERLPQVEAELEEVRKLLGEAHDTILLREQSIQRKNTEIDALNARVHEAEVARDHAETMFLEADDRTEKALAFVRSVFGNAGALIQALEPKPAEPVAPSPTPMAVESTEQVSAGGVTAEPQVVQVPTEITEPVYYTPDMAQPDPGPAIGEVSVSADPTIPAQIGEQRSEQTSVNSSVNVDATSATEPSPDPYANRLYVNYPSYVSRADWKAGGGTDETYDWREGDPLISN